MYYKITEKKNHLFSNNNNVLFGTNYYCHFSYYQHYYSKNVQTGLYELKTLPKKLISLAVIFIKINKNPLF